MSGCSKLTLAKFVDIFGRIEGFLLMLFISVLSLILKAVCTDIEMYFAAHTLYWIGHIGLIVSIGLFNSYPTYMYTCADRTSQYVIDVMVADMTTLRNRMIIFGINNTPMIASTFGGPRIAQLFYDNLNYRWAFGAFCIMLVGICFPVAGVMLFMQMQARRKGMLPRERSGRKWHQSVYYYLVQFDSEYHHCPWRSLPEI